MNYIEVSLIIPVLNEEKYIKRCIESLMTQTYPFEKMEWIFIDGMSSDNTVKICESYLGQAPIKILFNEKKKTTYALNLGIINSIGKYIIRLDAHAEYSTNYIEKCVECLETTDADNVGGVAVTKADGFIGSAIADMLSSRFGVGGSSFRINDRSGYVDTVPFGAYRKEIFNKIGMFNHDLIRSEDNDINARIRASGGKIWLSNEIKFTYYCRDTVLDLLKMGLKNGNALFHTFKINPSAMSIRHYVPFGFFVSIFVVPVAGIWFRLFQIAFGVELIIYFLLDIFFSFVKEPWQYGIVTVWLYPLFHLTYGCGSFLGLIGFKLY